MLGEMRRHAEYPDRSGDGVILQALRDGGTDATDTAVVLYRNDQVVLTREYRAPYVVPENV